METDQTDLKHRKTDNKTNESESEKNEQPNSKIDSATNVPTVIQTKEEYFDALRGWLQQVQLQQMAYAYFPYYLAANLQPNLNNVFIPSMPFLPTTTPPAAAAAAGAQSQFPAFPASPVNLNQPNNFANVGNGNAPNPADPFNRPPLFANTLFQPNRNNYMENMRQNMQILYQNGGYEYVIAPIWKRFLAEAVDVILLFIIKLMVVFMMIDLFNIQM